MKYSDYIKLGFERHDTECLGEFNDSGYYGYFLQKDITKHVFIEVNASGLDKPNLCVHKDDTNCLIHRVQLDCEMMLALIKGFGVKNK